MLRLRRSRAASPVNEDLQTALWRAFRQLSATGQRTVVAVAAVLVALLFAGPPLAVPIMLCSVILIGVSHRRTPDDDEWLPSDDELRRIDAARALADAGDYESSGAGDQSYERVLRELLALTGRDIQVQVGASEPGFTDWRLTSLHSGRLRTARNVSPNHSAEVLFFEVGAHGSGFFIEREGFAAAEAVVRRGGSGLEVRSADGVVLWISEPARAGAL